MNLYMEKIRNFWNILIFSTRKFFNFSANSDKSVQDIEILLKKLTIDAELVANFASRQGALPVNTRLLSCLSESYTAKTKEDIEKSYRALQISLAETITLISPTTISDLYRKKKIDNLISDGEIVADVAIRLGKLPKDNNLLKSISDLRRAKDDASIDSSYQELQLSLSNALAALDPINLFDLRKNWILSDGFKIRPLALMLSGLLTFGLFL